jgi:hypothetical protein
MALSHMPPPQTDDCKMAALDDEKSRTDILNRLKRAEGQLRGIQRMIEEGDACLDIATQRRWPQCARPWTAPMCAT